MSQEFLYVEKYRPKTVDECILPKAIKDIFLEFVKDRNVPNLILTGKSGVGKTTIATALCEQLKTDYILINASEFGTIDVLRNTIRQFVSTVSILNDCEFKVVILDEADYLNGQLMQPALRGFIEEFSKVARFIFTCNQKERLIDAIHSRCSIVEFNIPKKSCQEIAGQFHKRLKDILTKENIEFENSVLAELIMKYFPDFRKTLNEVQKFAVSGKIDAEIIKSSERDNFDDLIKALKNSQFTDMRKWVSNNLDSDIAFLMRQVYDNMYSFVKDDSIPTLVLILAEYSYKDAFVADHEINLVACLTQIMLQCDFV